MSDTHQTRLDAYFDILPRVSELQDQCLQKIFFFHMMRNEYPDYRQLASFMQKERETIQPRLTELKNMGLITAIKIKGKRCTEKHITLLGKQYLKSIELIP